MSFPSIPPMARVSMLRHELALPVYALLFEDALTAQVEGREAGTTCQSAGDIKRALKLQSIAPVYTAIKMLLKKGYISEAGKIQGGHGLFGHIKNVKPHTVYRINPVDEIQVDEQYGEYLKNREAALAAA